IVDERCLADAGFAAQHESAAPPVARCGQQLVELRALGRSAVQHPSEDTPANATTRDFDGRVERPRARLCTHQLRKREPTVPLRTQTPEKIAIRPFTIDVPETDV